MSGAYLVRLTGEKCLRRRRAKNHVVGFRECYWFSGGSQWENALEKEGKMAAVWELTELWFSYLFERSRLVLWPISSGPYSMENITLRHRLASRFQPVVGYKSMSWHDVFRQKGLRKRWVIFAFFDSVSLLPRGTKRYYKGTKEWFLSFV